MYSSKSFGRGRYDQDVDFLRFINNKSSTATNQFLYNHIARKNPNIQIYPNKINLIIDPNNKNPMNSAITKPEYFKKLTQFENKNFKNLKDEKPSKAVKTSNRRFLHHNLFEEIDKSKYDKKINKYIIRKEFKKIMIFLVTIYFIKFDNYGRMKLNGSHRSLFLYNSEENQGYYIDPESEVREYTSMIQKYKTKIRTRKRLVEKNIYNVEDLVVNKINKIIPKILKIDKIKISLPNYVCPQSITNDENCVFWTFLLAESIITDFIKTGKLDITKTLERIYLKYSEKFPEVIEMYKGHVLKILDKYEKN